MDLHVGITGDSVAQTSHANAMPGQIVSVDQQDGLGGQPSKVYRPVKVGYRCSTDMWSVMPMKRPEMRHEIA